MKHFLLKFNYGVEIGAFFAYMGHYKRTKDYQVLNIACEEIEHRSILGRILYRYGELPNKYINFAFTLIGKSVYWACRICPIWSLNLVARTLETFAVFSYEYLAKKYPAYREEFLEMASVERKHEEYFK